VVGYSRLIIADEAGTLHAFKNLRDQRFAPTIATHNGRFVKTTGDGFLGDGLLIEFGSVVDALSGAVQVQRETTKGKARMAFRIGINVGDFVVEGRMTGDLDR
jgi:adenylate cyclase